MKSHFLLLAAVASAMAAEKPRVFITDSHAVQVASETATGDAKSGLLVSGGASRESIEVIRTFADRCPAVVVTSNREKADYVVRFDREAPSPMTPFVHGNKVAVFNKNDDLVYSSSTRLLPAAVKGACGVIAGTSKKSR